MVNEIYLRSESNHSLTTHTPSILVLSDSELGEPEVVVTCLDASDTSCSPSVCKDVDIITWYAAMKFRTPMRSNEVVEMQRKV